MGSTPSSRSASGSRTTRTNRFESERAGTMRLHALLLIRGRGLRGVRAYRWVVRCARRVLRKEPRTLGVSDLLYIIHPNLRHPFLCGKPHSCFNTQSIGVYFACTGEK